MKPTVLQGCLSPVPFGGTMKGRGLPLGPLWEDLASDYPGSSFILQGERAPSLLSRCNYYNIFVYNLGFLISRSQDILGKGTRRSTVYSNNNFNKPAGQATVCSLCWLASQILQASSFTQASPHSWAFLAPFHGGVQVQAITPNRWLVAGGWDQTGAWHFT